MIRFVGKVLGVVSLFVAIVAGTFVSFVLYHSKSLDKAYELGRDQDILFCGSSQIGCGIVEGDEYHNKVIWMETSSLPSFVVWLLELERRRQLGSVRKLVINVNAQSIEALTDEYVSRTWFHSLPLTWRYLGRYPGDYLFLVKYALQNLGRVFHWRVNGGQARSGVSLVERDEAWRASYFKTVDDDARRRSLTGKIFDWECKLDAAWMEINEICNRCGIELIVVSMPILERSREQYPSAYKGWIEDFIDDQIVKKKVCYVDLSEMNEKYFFDFVHLTRVGAKVATDKLYDKLHWTVRRPLSRTNDLEQ